MATSYAPLASSCRASATSEARLACAAATSWATASGDFALLQPEAAAIASSATSESVSLYINNSPFELFETTLVTLASIATRLNSRHEAPHVRGFLLILVSRAAAIG